MQSLPVFVISLKSATERRALIEEHLRGLGIDYELINAVKGDELEPSYRREINPAGNMSPGTLGCYLSHIHVYERMIEKQLPVALILEDDTVLIVRKPDPDLPASVLIFSLIKTLWNHLSFTEISSY